MNYTKLIHRLSLAAVSLIVTGLTALALNLYWAHQAVTHHAAHYETSSWGVPSFVWNDSYAQVVDPADSLTPPPFITKNK